MLALFLRKVFDVDLPWLVDPGLDCLETDRRVDAIVHSINHNLLPYIILNPFNSDGVALHCIGLDCRFRKAIVLDAANVNSFEFTPDTLNAVCNGSWSRSFRRIFILCSRALPR